MVLICISLMTRNVEHICMYPLVIHTSLLENCLFGSFAHFQLDYCHCYFAIELFEFFTYLDINCLSHT